MKMKRVVIDILAVLSLGSIIVMGLASVITEAIGQKGNDTIFIAVCFLLIVCFVFLYFKFKPKKEGLSQEQKLLLDQYKRKLALIETFMEKGHKPKIDIRNELSDFLVEARNSKRKVSCSELEEIDKEFSERFNDVDNLPEK